MVFKRPSREVDFHAHSEVADCIPPFPTRESGGFQSEGSGEKNFSNLYMK